MGRRKDRYRVVVGYWKEFWRVEITRSIILCVSVLPYTNAEALKRTNWQKGRWRRALLPQLRADVAVAVAAVVDAVAVAAVDGMGVVAVGADVMIVDDGAVGVGDEMGVELDVDVDSTPSGCTTAHNE